MISTIVQDKEMRYVNLFIFIILNVALSHRCLAQTPPIKQVETKPVNAETPTFRLFLIGDAGEGDTTGATLLDLKKKLADNPNSAVVFLGDNCYKKMFFGLISLEMKGYDGGKITRRRMMSQLNILRDYKGSAYFVPGNHDWWNMIHLKGGKKHLLKEQLFVEDTLRNFTSILNHNDGTFLPVNGTLGPISRDFNNGKTRLIFIDTYRLIIEEGAKRHRDSLLINTFYKELKNQLTDASNKHEKIIVVGHHPIHSKGKHSLPLIFWERLNRRFADSNPNYPPYNRMAVHLDSLLKEHHHPDVYYVAGHEHSLEYFITDSLHYIVSGAGSKIDKVKMEDCKDGTQCLKWNQGGFFEIDFYGLYETVLMYHRKDNKTELEVECLTGCN